MDIIKTLTAEFSLKATQVENAVKLLDDGNTVPFIARYRKEMTGSLDDQVLRELADRLTYLRSLDEQREKVRASITEQGAMTDEIANLLDAALTMTEIDDIYRPFRPKRKTRATVALAKGLKPLADSILNPERVLSLEQLAADFIDPELEVNTAEEALQGASDIIAEVISDDASIRKRLRVVCYNFGLLTAYCDKEDAGVYEMYRKFSEKLSKVASHRILAINRGEKEDFLKVSIEFDEARAHKIIGSVYAPENHPYKEFLENTIEDSYSRLLFPSLEREIRNELTSSAAESAIKVFSLNLKQLLMAPPVKGKVTLGLDPGYRTGCKVAVVDETGKVLDTGVIYPVPPHNKTEESEKIITNLCKKHKVEIIAIGNGTASHETEVFASNLIKKIGGISYMVVSEAGASVYSASKLAAKEFPDYDVSLRSAVSIARRLEDPLAELVKIDPKAIGVGQYQHDMPQNELGRALSGVVEACVNSVGVDLNTASAPLLSRVSGLSDSVAQNIVVYREENGAFKSRSELKKVPKLGPKAFQQCAGFLRITGGKNILDSTAVHPESYDAAEKLLALCGYTDKDVTSGSITDIYEKINLRGTEKVAEELGIGVPTLNDIAEFLSKPGRDPRDDLPAPLLRTDVMSLEDLKEGMELKGTVRNVVDFGAFIDIGVHEDGLVHISQICDRFIRHPSEELSVGDIVTVYVLSVDVKKKRISLTMKKK